jgi:hypothetical protein
MRDGGDDVLIINYWIHYDGVTLLVATSSFDLP